MTMKRTCTLTDAVDNNNNNIYSSFIIVAVITLQPNQQLSRRTALIQSNTKQVYTTKHNTRFSTGILSCYIQALGSPRYRN